MSALDERERGTVWIVEDSALEAEMARRALAPTQHVEVMGDGSLALERFAAGVVPDAIVLDWQLPSVNGVDVCRVLRATHDANALPILMLTAQGRKEDVAFAIAAGANDYVTKPYDIAELVARVQTLVRTSHLQRVQIVRARELELAAHVGVLVTNPPTPHEMIARAADALVAHTDANVAGVWVQTDAGLVLSAASSKVDAAPLPESLAREAAKTRTARVEAGALAVPLVLRENVIGVIAVAGPANTSTTSSSLETIAHLLAVGIARGRAEEERAALLDRERAARADAEQANRSKDEFLAIVSHELRTPLNAILGWATMLTSGTLDAASAKRAIVTIERNARAQAQLIDDLLDVSRIASGKLNLERSSIDMASIAELALESVRPSAAARKVELQAAIAADLPEVIGDADRIKQVVLNVLGNAIKFTPAGGSVKLTVDASGGAVELVVTDTGRGIAPDFLPFIFDRFRQADGSATRSSGGLGLGLAIVRHLVELHGGTIEATSEGFGKGAQFRVRLPAETRRRAHPAPEPSAPAITFSTRYPNLRGLRALLVDDEPDARELMTILLEQCGIAVDAVGGAADAFASLQRTMPDVLLSDIAMPEEDGLALIRRIRALPKEAGGNVRAVALTAFARIEDRANALRAGFDGYVAKPIDPAELFSVIDAVASSR